MWSSTSEHYTKPCRKISSEDSRLQLVWSSWQEDKREREREREKNGKETGMRKRRQVGVTKALRWDLLWILLGTKMQMVEAAGEEISTRQETDCKLEKVSVFRAGNEIRWKRM